MGGLVGFIEFGIRRDVRIVTWLTTRMTWLACRIVGLRIRVVSPDGTDGYRPKQALYVANHISYLDALILHSFLPARFVTSQEFAETPFLGGICRAGGCLFVERRYPMRVGRDISTLVENFHAGHSVVLFPEGTTSNGCEMLPFKSSLFAAADQTRVPVVPITINFTAANRKPITPCERDSIAWYGDTGFLPHLWSLMQLSHIEVVVRIHDALPKLGPRSRKRYAQESRGAIGASWIPIC